MSKALRAGAAKIDITPTPDYFPVFNKKNGIGGGPDSIFIRAHDPIFIRAMVIENDENRVLILSYDWGVLDSLYDDGTMFVKLAAEAAGIPETNVLSGATHNHNCFDLMMIKRMKRDDPDCWGKAVKYQALIEKAVPEVVKAAVANLQPAKAGFGKSQCYANVNRHCYSKTGEPSIAGFEPDKPSDRDLIVLNVRTLDDKPIGVIYNYAAHASLLANNKPDGEHTELSGDWPGYVSRKLEDYLGNDAVALYLPSGAGDQNAVIIARVYKVLDNGKGEMFDFGAVGYIVLDFISDMIFRSAVEAIDGIETYKEETRIWSGKEAVTVTKDYFDFDGGKFNSYHAFTPEDEAKGPEFQFTLIMLGDIALAATNGEIYTQIGMRFKELSPYAKTMFISLAGHMLGYIKDDSGTGKAELLIRDKLYGLMEEYCDGE